MPSWRALVSTLFSALLLLTLAACQRSPAPSPGANLACIWVMDAQPGDAAVAVEGLVLAGDGKPIPAAAIQVIRRDGSGLSYDTRSDTAGRFSLWVPTEEAPMCLHARSGDSIHVECGSLPTSSPVTLHALLVLTGSTAPPVTILTDDRDRRAPSAAPISGPSP